jgi:ketosteroid isomerase-like protein
MMPASEPEDEFGRVLEQVQSATERMMAGDSGPWKALFSPGDDVVLMGAFGGVFRDHAAIGERLDGTAQVYSGGDRVSVERLATWVGADLACAVELVRHEGVRLAGHAPTTTAYRVTHVFRHEADGWKAVLRHADPLAEFRGPEVVLPRDG